MWTGKEKCALCGQQSEMALKTPQFPAAEKCLALSSILGTAVTGTPKFCHTGEDDGCFGIFKKTMKVLSSFA